jgi:chromate reductase
MPETLRILAFAGSLRRNSYNRALLRAAIELAPDDLTLEVVDLAPIPLYDGDVEAQGLPAPVADFRARIKAADALLIATPEYNASIPGVLKNALDWASRGPDSPLQDKPVAILGASPGRLGTANAQHALRQTFVFTNTHPLMQPQVFVALAKEKFDADLRLVDEPTRAAIGKLLAALGAWTRRLKSA